MVEKGFSLFPFLFPWVSIDSFPWKNFFRAEKSFFFLGKRIATFSGKGACPVCKKAGSGYTLYMPLKMAFSLSGNAAVPELVVG